MNPPKIIWLQWQDPDGETTWCQDKINDDDIEYVLSSELAAWKAEALAARELLSMSTCETHKTDMFAQCDYCNAEAWSGHKKDCRYRVAKEAYLAARVKDGAK